jgi:phosphate transport system substrate-binding protein
MYKKQEHPDRAVQVLKFFDWGYEHGDKLAMELDYVPMPASVVKQIEGAWASIITDTSGKPVWKAMN